MEPRRPLLGTVFARFSAMAQRLGAVNLGQGFPDFDGPAEVREAAARHLRDASQQYATSVGVSELRYAIAAHAERFYRQSVNPETEVLVTCGATEALMDAVLAFAGSGDEVVVFEPSYDSYAAAVAISGASLRPVRLHPPSGERTTWWFRPEELVAAFSRKTRLVLINTPHNPTGKVFTRRELEHIAELAARHDTTVVCDEVYEHLVYPPAQHVRFATLPGARDRTLTVSSAGKTLALTGWKVGWAIGPEPLLEPVKRLHAYVTFATPAALQVAAGVGLGLPDAYFHGLVTDYAQRRDLCLQALRNAGFSAAVPEGSYFAMADVSLAEFETDVGFCEFLTEHVGVAAIPPSVFYASQPPQTLARFAFCKELATLNEAARRLGGWRAALAVSKKVR